MDPNTTHFDPTGSTSPVTTVKGSDGKALRIDTATYDADPSKYELFEDSGDNQGTGSGSTASAVTLPQSLNVVKEGKKHFVTDADGSKFVDSRFNDKGYDSDTAAWQAITDAYAAQQTNNVG